MISETWTLFCSVTGPAEEAPVEVRLARLEIDKPSVIKSKELACSLAAFLLRLASWLMP